MRLINPRNAIRTVAARWGAQYPTATEGKSFDIAQKLNALNPETATAAEVNKIIGNNSWTTVRCCECGEYVESAVEFGRDGDEARLCQLCAKVAGAAAAIL